MISNIDKFIFDELQKLQVEEVRTPQNLENEIYRVLKTRKFRKHSASEDLLNRIQKAITYNVQRNKPINITFLQGSYKLWRLKEAPEVDWAELFALMHYATWVKPILAFYRPGIIFDFYIDDWIMEKLSNYRRDEIISYQNSFQKVIDFVMLYCPPNLHYKITTVSSQYKSESEFWNKLNLSVDKWEKPQNIKLDESLVAMIDLNYRPNPNEIKSNLWREENIRLHDAYSALEERLKYRQEVGKILAMPWHYTGAHDRLFLGSTKASVVKYWMGVGALKIKGESFIPTVLSPKQLSTATFFLKNVEVEGLDAKNFKNIRILKL